MRFIPVLAAAAAVAAATPALAQGPDPNLARNLAATCANCHGTNGVSAGGIESLAGSQQGRARPQDAGVQVGQRSRGRSCPSSPRATPTRRSTLIAGWFAAQKPAK